MTGGPLLQVLRPIGVLLLLAAPAAAQAKNYQVRLKRAWVASVADRTSVAVTMEVRHAHKHPNSIDKSGDDGDLHFSGVSPGVGLPFVAEVVNAAGPSVQAAVSLVQAKEQSGDGLRLTGAWRFWFEHPATKQTQGGQNVFFPDHTNPDHSFEIHPASRLDQLDLGESFIPILGYTAYTADVAFGYFDKVEVTIKASQSGISIRSQKLKYNYVEFEIELTQAPKQVADGFIALAKVLNDSDEEVADGPRRMIFVGGTVAEQKIQGAAAGDRFRVLGIPRINLNAVLALAKKNGTAQFDAQLPYEMIVVGVK